jgi:EAL domain-containing protein (putative c-di-GMP-specific phosphodiesterase class I)
VAIEQISVLAYTGIHPRVASGRDRGGFIGMRLVVLICCAAALLAAAGSLLLTGRYETALIAAVAMLVCAQVVSLLASSRPKEVEDARLASLSEGIKRNARSIEQLSTRTRDQAQALAEIKQTIEKSRTQPALQAPARPQIAAPVPESIKPVAAVDHHPAPPQAPAPATPQLAPQPARLPPQEPQQPSIFLEPVVRLAEGRTAYYKASLQRPAAVPGGRPHTFVSADINVRDLAAAQWPMRHDLHMLQEVMPVLAKLRARRGATGLFVPLGVATLESKPQLEAVVALLQQNPDAAAGIVLDLNVSALAVMPEAAMRGLAWLASLGATFCLSGASASNNDLAALAELGFAFLDVPEHELVDGAGQLLPAALHLRQDAAAHRFTIIASSVSDNARAASLMQAVSLARGPNFASPRALKPQGAGTAGDRADQQVA